MNHHYYASGTRTIKDKRVPKLLTLMLFHGSYPACDIDVGHQKIASSGYRSTTGKIRMSNAIV
jgi:hypothetical protein